MNLDLLQAECYDSEKQCLTLKTRTAGILGGSGYASVTTEISFFWDVVFVHTGDVDIVINMSNRAALHGANIEVDVDGQKLASVASVTGNEELFTTFKIGSVHVKRTGRLVVKLSAKPVESNHDFQFMELSGPAAVDTIEDGVPCSPASVFFETCEYELAYVSFTAVLSHPIDIFHVLMFNGGYISIEHKDIFVGCTEISVSLSPDEENGETVRVVKTANDTGVIQLLEREKDVEPSSPGVFIPWNLNETYHVAVKAKRAEGDKSVLVSAYFYLNDLEQWKLIAMYEVANRSDLLTHICHAVSTCGLLNSGYFAREAMFGPIWCRLPNNEWKETTSRMFTEPWDTLINVDAAVKDNRFLLRTGGHTLQTCKLGTVLMIEPTHALPEVLKDIDDKLSAACECAKTQSLKDSSD